MKETILKKLEHIQQQFKVKILFAVEAGSRAWGLSSEKSDYDVRFIYIHETHWYLSIDPQTSGKKRDTIHLPVNKDLDISGWEMTKALRLFRKSNPSFLEWLHSPIVYLQATSFLKHLKKLEPVCFSPTSSLYHYFNMAKGNYKEISKNRGKRVKPYINCIRPILACKWIIKYDSFPPTDFETLLHETLPSGELKMEIERIKDQKIKGEGKDFIPNSKFLNPFIEEELQNIQASIKNRSPESEDPTETLNQLFRSILQEAWKENL